MRKNDNTRMFEAEALLHAAGFHVHHTYGSPGKTVIVAIGTVDKRTVSLRLHNRKISVEWGGTTISEISIMHGNPEELVATVLAGKGTTARRMFGEAKP